MCVPDMRRLQDTKARERERERGKDFFFCLGEERNEGGMWLPRDVGLGS